MAGKGPLYNLSLKDKTAKGPSRIALCALCFFFDHPLVFLLGDREKFDL
jgi:hypothetical protein